MVVAESAILPSALALSERPGLAGIGDHYSRRRISGVAFLAIISALAAVRALAAAGQAAAPAPAQVAPPAALAGKPANTALPPGTVLYLRLNSLISTKASHLHDPITARVVREVTTGNGVAIPLGAVVSGRIEKLIPSSSPTDRARLLMRFTRLEIPGQAPVALAGHVAEVGNAREKVLADGAIQGVLASELPISRIEAAVAKLGQANPELAGQAQKTKEQALGKSDTSIEFPAGTDLEFVLDKPLPVQQVFQPAVPDQLPSDLEASVDRLLADAPQRTSSKDGKPGDPLNLVMIGSAGEIRQAFRQGGWNEAEQKSPKSIWETLRAVVDDRGYGAAPVSQLYLLGRPEDLAFEKMFNTFAKRHHLRLWRSLAKTSGGREIWLGAATHDTGIEARAGVVSHAIDPNLDIERAQVGADLLVTGRVGAEHLVARPHPLTEGLTATGGSWKTDGRLLVIDLEAR